MGKTKDRRYFNIIICVVRSGETCDSAIKVIDRILLLMCKYTGARTKY